MTAINVTKHRTKILEYNKNFPLIKSRVLAELC